MQQFRGNFEVHLTVASQCVTDQLEAWCLANDSKFVLIQLSRGTHAQQPMATWQRSHTVLSQVLQEAHRRAEALNRLGLPVVRIKIETDPNNEEVPILDTEAESLPGQNYFEHHVKLRRKADENLQELADLCMQHAAHLSRNARRVCVHGTEERFVTTRAYHVGKATSDARVQELILALNSFGETIVEVESEYTVYDSHIELDAGWLAPSRP